MASKADFVSRVQQQAQGTFEVITGWNTIVKEAMQLGYLGVLGNGDAHPELALTDADLGAARGDSFDAQTLIAVVLGAKQLSETIENGGSLAAMCKVKG